MKRTNPLIEIYRQCNAKSNIEKYNLLNDNKTAVPVYLDIELTNCCNIKCNMCPVGTSVMKRPKGFMSDDTFNKIVNNIQKYKIKAVRFIRWGEPTLHPQFTYWGGVLKKLGVLVHFNTNGILLDEKMIREIIDMKIDSVKFSFQGIDELTYSEMRNGGSYDTLVDNIKLLYNIRGQNISPYISVTTTVTYESEEEISCFKRNISQYCDEVGVGRTLIQHIDVEKMSLSEERREKYKKFISKGNMGMQRISVCPEIWDKLSINWDGSVSACCGDYDNAMLVGNINDEDLMEIFTGEKERRYREILKNDDFDRIPLCKNCYEYIPLKK